ncbi:flagellar M-ring protein FliF [Dissulfurirhabdus thermomarina]|uniref:Flagellar M-ring protein n=1 Tax=Dissulfurirhabdus thermomarina TaxID=1765737 RepID=A0A6N9TT11_DISTH|nr:flagellar basal-body MS-ring/collar protein FliF [Dissulfurirhabdus thermomarina]NDY42884.1 flagellar M-ring protein FliF [Dissulfurirhabdus thermomarina]NMX23901.1 flagellar M-ring protein FliF [Dissulfurirhabdus thermomarina]
MATGDPLAQLQGIWRQLDLRQRIVSGLVILFTFAAFAGLYVFTSQATYGVLYKDLAPEDAADIVEWLKTEGIPYRLSGGGTAVEVPQDKVYEARLSLASKGLPKGQSVGFEIFDQNRLGATEFVQKVNYQRALQGELERTIARFPQVESVRVHLAQPEEAVFVAERREPTASVVLRLKSGMALSDAQVRGVAFLVASAVPRLQMDKVSVVDTSGNILFPERPAGGTGDHPTTAQLQYRRNLENYYKQKIQSMLEDALGPSKAVARVSAEIDFDEVSLNEDRYDPDTVAVRSEQKVVEGAAAPGAPGGVPGVKGALADKLQGNLGGGAAAAGAAGTRREQSVTNYEITRLQRQVRGAVGKIKRLSVGVLVDGTYKTDEKTGQRVYVPRTPEEMANLERIVRAAMGFSDDRGDELSVVNVPFTTEGGATGGGMEWPELGSRLLRPLVHLALALAFIVFVLRPLLKRYVLQAPGAGPRGLPGGEPLEALEEDQKARLAARRRRAALGPLPSVHEELRELAQDYPERAAALIKVWLREPSPEESGGS